MASLIIESGPNRGEILELQMGSNLLGRAEDCHFTIADPTVSSRHCEVIVTEFGVRVRDLGSSNGTTVNAIAVQECDLADGQILMLGSLTLRIILPPIHIAIPELSAPETGEPPVLEDGSRACHNHPGVAAALECTQCGRTFCDECVHRVRLVGAASRLLCPSCSYSCRRLSPETAPTAAPTRAGRLLETIRIAFDFRRQKPPPSGGH